ncbi:alanine/glycine:cation symporter family protein [Microbacterium karelineae]|uniref:alanine/glycine:cation symporter family protein n=1 Tax=Microbacterium karelineae TaxID=2654283 RepID=UPI0012E9BAA0|nr:alanine/glycine:cation symporter family protein [Microbacterium karelineae]
MEILSSISNLIWDPIAYFALGLGVLFTILTKGVQFRRLPDMFRQLRNSKAEHGGLSSFQTMALTLSSRMGVGSIAGVATAIASGGPGAIFWMAVTGLVGSTVAYAEAVLAQLYKRRIDGEDRGGMPYYIKYGLRAPWLAMIVAGVAFVGYGFVFPGIQANNIASSAELAFGLEPWITGLIVTGILAIVIIGGTKRIVHVAEGVIPFMGAGYIITAIVIVVMNASRIPETAVLIFQSAIGIDPLFGGIVGYAVMWGVRRAVFASATGMGEGTFSSAAARTSHPGKQGIVQAFSIYIDVLFVCMATGLMITITGTYHVLDRAGNYLLNNVGDAVAGPNFVQLAIDTTLPGWGSVFVAIAILLFAFTSQIFFFYVASTNLLFLFGNKRNKAMEVVLKIGALAISFFGAIVNARAMWAVGDIGYGVMTWLNMICVLLLAPIVWKVVKDYDRQRREGYDPRLDVEELGVKGADWWEADARGEFTGGIPIVRTRLKDSNSDEGN